VCQALKLAQNQGTFLQLALDGDYVYWSGDTAAIGRARIDGSEPAEELVPAAAQEHGYEIVAIGQTLYWGNDWKDNGIRGCVLPACTLPMTLIAGTTPIYVLLYDRHSERLFWNQSNVIWTKPLPAGSSQVFFTAEKTVQHLATDSDFLYWAEFDVDTQTSKIRKRGLDGGDAALLGGNVGSASNLTVFRDTLYFIGPGATLHALPLPNGIGNAASEQFAASVAVKSVVADRDGIVWVQHDTPTDGTVRWCPHEGCTGQPEIRATVPKPWSVVTDETSIYWSSGTGSVFRLAK
jgi:hypothetical protein